MNSGVSVVAIALAYVGVLFALAWFGDRRANGARTARPFLYALSLAVFCTSWTFLGSVGLAASTGYDFLPVYVGGVVAFGLGWRLVQHIVRVAKSNRLTSVADFMSLRYGGSPTVAGVVTTIALVGTLPYIALQLKAIVLSLDVLVGASRSEWFDTALAAAALLAIFTALFGTRHSDATEHQDGMMLAIAAESLIKLIAFLTVGLFVLFSVFGSPAGFVNDVMRSDALSKLFLSGINPATWLTVSLLSLFAILLLPRQFHVIVVENRDLKEVRVARWLFPAYLVAINLFVIPIAAAGLMVLPTGTAGDTFVLRLPLALQSEVVALVAFLGALSAATAMVIVDTVALALMISNGIVVPQLIDRRGRQTGQSQVQAGQIDGDMVPTLLWIRRAAIFIILGLGYGTYLLIESVQGLAGIGLVSFAAIAQLAPAFFAGLFWRYGTAAGAVSGMVAGFSVWAYTLVTPWLIQAGIVPSSVLLDGPFGLTFLVPQALFHVELSPLPHGVVWSLAVNVLVFVFVSLQRSPTTAEGNMAAEFSVFSRPGTYRARGQADRTPAGIDAVTIGELRATIARYLGEARTDRGFREFELHTNRKLQLDQRVDPQVWVYAQKQLTSAVGAAAARLIIARRLTRGRMSGKDALDLLDTADEALRDNQQRLQSALDHVQQGLAVFDAEQRLVNWNRQFRFLLQLPESYGQIGIGLTDILHEFARRRPVNRAELNEWIADRQRRMTGADKDKVYFEHLEGGARVLEVRTNPVPAGGFILTVTDVTERRRFLQQLEQANTTLEARVEAATKALKLAKDEADQASLNKTTFLATAGHDVMQPLQAARVYNSSLIEKLIDSPQLQTAQKVDRALDTVEEILTALIEIAKADSGRTEPNLSKFPLSELLRQLEVEFTPLAEARKLKLTFVQTTAWVESDRRLLRRACQNLVSNALKYTRSGGVVVGVRRVPAGPGQDGLGHVEFQVTDQGVGIPASQFKSIFGEFQRLERTAEEVQGIGLGLSIVERVCKTLNLPLKVASVVDKGSTFRIRIPRAAPVVQPVAQELSGTGFATHSGQFTGFNVLLIDNDADILDSMELLLTGWGCKVAKALSTKAALAHLNSTHVVPDLILADYHLGTGTGVTAVLSIHVLLGQQVPAAIITADPSPVIQDEARIIRAPMLRKPLKPGPLRAMISSLAIKQAAE